MSSMSLTVVNQGEVTYATVLGARFAAGLKVSLGHGVRCRVAVGDLDQDRGAPRDRDQRAAFGAHTLTVTNPDRASAHAARGAAHRLRGDPRAVGHRPGRGRLLDVARATDVRDPAHRLGRAAAACRSTTRPSARATSSTSRFSVEQHAAATWRTMTITQGLSTWQVENGVRIRQAPTRHLGHAPRAGHRRPGRQGPGRELRGVRGVGAAAVDLGDRRDGGLGVRRARHRHVRQAHRVADRSDRTARRHGHELRLARGRATSANAFAVLGPPVVTLGRVPRARREPHRGRSTGTNFTPTTASACPGRRHDRPRRLRLARTDARDDHRQPDRGGRPPRRRGDGRRREPPRSRAACSPSTRCRRRLDRPRWHRRGHDRRR